MYKVFLVDDEIVAREAIRSNIPWDKTDFTLAGEAPDGEIALALMREIKPDILITDIRMPFMDGMELCRNVARTMPWIHIIILSACDSFADAREAISLGVKDYLLKPIDTHVLLSALERAAARIREERNRQAALNAYQEQLVASNRFLKERLILELCEGRESGGIIRAARALRMNLLAKDYLVMILEPVERDLPDPKLLCAWDALEQLNAGKCGSSFLARTRDGFVMLVLGDTPSDLEERAHALSESARLVAEQKADVKLLTAIGTDVEDIAKVPFSFMDARQIMKRQRMSAQELSTQRSMNLWDISQKALSRLIELDAAPISEHLQNATEDDIDAILSRFFEGLDDEAEQSVMTANYAYLGIMISASRIIRDNGGDPKEVLQAALSANRAPVLDVRAVRPLCREALRCAIEFRNQQDSTRYGNVIRKAKAFIGNHYADSSVTLHDVAVHVALSSNHFCTVFSQETGVTFTEYLTSVRIARAKELLSDSDMRTSEIAYAVGYNDPHYFSHLFKKNTGRTPREYKKETRNRNIIY